MSSTGSKKYVPLSNAPSTLWGWTIPNPWLHSTNHPYQSTQNERLPKTPLHSPVHHKFARLLTPGWLASCFWLRRLDYPTPSPSSNKESRAKAKKKHRQQNTITRCAGSGRLMSCKQLKQPLAILRRTIISCFLFHFPRLNLLSCTVPLPRRRRRLG